MDTKTLLQGADPECTEKNEDAGIDPRIRDRRVRVQRDEDRSRLGKLIVVLALVAMVAGSVAALRSPLLDVDHIVVSGTSRTSADDVVAASGVRRRMALGDVALSAASRRVASLPWVLRATVRRRWPGTVQIKVSERRPQVEIRDRAGGWLLIDVTGRLLGHTTSARPGLVQFTGTEVGRLGSWLDARWNAALAVATSLPRDLRPQVVGVRRVEREGIGLRLLDGIEVTFGSGEDSSAKLEALRTLLAQPDRRCFASINLQVANAPALTRRPGCG